MESNQYADNSIHQSIKVTIVYPTGHPHNSLPAFDIEVWLETRNDRRNTLFLVNMVPQTPFKYSSLSIL